jgi:hypothetical protein
MNVKVRELAICIYILPAKFSFVISTSFCHIVLFKDIKAGRS